MRCVRSYTYTAVLSTYIVVKITCVGKRKLMLLDKMVVLNYISYDKYNNNNVFKKKGITFYKLIDDKITKYNSIQYI